MEYFFEFCVKEVLFFKKVGEGCWIMIIVLDFKCSNVINIGLIILLFVYVIKVVLFNFDEFVVSKDGIEKLLIMMFMEEEW